MILIKLRMLQHNRKLVKEDHVAPSGKTNLLWNIAPVINIQLGDEADIIQNHKQKSIIKILWTVIKLLILFLKLSDE